MGGDSRENGLYIVRQVVGYISACQDMGIGYVDACNKSKNMFADTYVPDDIWSCIFIGAISVYEEMNNLPPTYSIEVISKAAKQLAEYIYNL